MIRHMAVNVQGMINHFKGKNLDGMLEDENGKPLSHQQATVYLHNLSIGGYKYIPRHDCDGFDPFNKGCPVHELKED